MQRFLRTVVDHPWLTLVAIGVVTGVLGGFIPGIQTEQDFMKYLPEDDPAVQAMRRAEERYGAQAFSLIALVHDAGVLNLSTLAKIEGIEEEISHIPGVELVQSPLSAQVITGTEAAIVVGPAGPGGRAPKTPEELAAFRERALASQVVGTLLSEDERAAAIMFTLDPRLTTPELEVIAQQVMDIVAEQEGPERIYVAGGPYEALYMRDVMMHDISLLLPVVILVIALVLYTSFRTLRGVLIPLGVTGLAIVWTVGAMALAGVPFTVVSIIMPVILVAIGSADGIHILNRYYEAAAHSSRREAVITAMADMTSPVLMTSLTTAAGFLALLFSFLIPQREFGLFTAVGIISAMIISFTLIPAALMILPLPKGRALALEGGWLSRGLARLGRGVARRRAWVLGAAVVVLGVALASMPLLELETDVRQYIGEDTPILETYQVMEEYFGGAMQMTIEIDTGQRNGLRDPELLGRIVALQGFLEEDPWISQTSSLADLVRELSQKFHGDDPAYYVVPADPRAVSQLLELFTLQGGGLGSMATRDLSAGMVAARLTGITSSRQVEELEGKVEEYLTQHFPDVRAESVGVTRVTVSLMERLLRSQIWSLMVSLLAVWAVVSLLARSATFGLVSIVPLILTVAVNFGVMVLAGRPLDIATMMIGSVVIGIGVDYAVHFQSRFRREFARSGDPQGSLERTMRTSGRGIAYNALTIALGFAVLLLSGFAGTSTFGWLISAAMALSALCALTVIPALLSVWHPRFLRKKESRAGFQPAQGGQL
jgi:hypothetical protein